MSKMWNGTAMTKRAWICGKCEERNCSCRNTCKKCGDDRSHNKGWEYT